MSTAQAPRPAYQPVCDYYYCPSSENGRHPGVTPHYYLLVETASALTCECLGGQFGRYCWHKQMVDAGAVKPARLTRQPHDAVGQVAPVVWRRPAPSYAGRDDLYN